MKKLALLAALFTSAASAQDWMATEVTHVEVAPGFYLLIGTEGKAAGGNIGLMVGHEYVVLIDDGFTPVGEALLTEIRKLSDGRNPDFVINTHAHGDHTGANQYLAENGSIIVAHDNLRKRMKDDPNQNTGPGALPVITFSENVTFHVNGIEAYVFHVHNAHTDGDAAIEFRGANVIATGDLLFRGIFPFIDLDSGGNVAGYMKAMQKLIDMGDAETKYISGHGPVATREGLINDLEMLKDAEARVKALVDKGMSADEIVAANPLEIYHDDYNWFFITTERMTKTFIRSLTSE